MRIAPGDAVTAHASRHVAGVAGFYRVTAHAAGGLRFCFQGMPSQKIATVDELSLDAFRTAPLDREVLRHVMAVVALRLRVARLAELLFLLCELTVSPGKSLIMRQKRLRQRPLEVRLHVTRHTFALVPLLLVLMAGQTLAHRRQGVPRFPHHARMARHALPLERLHRQMPIVVEANRSGYARRTRFQNRQNLVRIVAVAARTHFALRQLVRAVALRDGVTVRAGQACRLAFGPAVEAREMLAMRKTWRCAIRARCYERRHQERDREAHVQSQAALVHGTGLWDERSKSTSNRTRLCRSKLA
jgi:hypothetical protein